MALMGQHILGRQSKPTVVNELKFGGKNFDNYPDITEGFNDYFSNIELNFICPYGKVNIYNLQSIQYDVMTG